MGRVVGGFMEGLLGLFGGGFRSRSWDETYNNSTSGGRGEQLASELFVHRFINVMIHAAIVQIVGVVATLLFSRNNNPSSSNSNHKPSNLQLYTKYISQILFALHPVHVEAVANVANRPHILALLLNTTIVDPNVPLVAVAVLATLGLLTAETAIFQFPAIVLTMMAIRYRELLATEKNDSKGKEEKPSQQSLIIESIVTLLPRFILLVLISTMYLIYRHYNDTLSIPVGLFRPAENPFYDKLDKGEWTLERRIMNYSYILSMHIMKSFGVEVVGFSHEYGFDCIPEIQSFQDYRLLLPISLLFLFEGMAAWSWYGWKMGSKRTKQQPRREQEERVQRILLLLVFFSWMATLFPISGILKVGTFVADRIALASSFGSCIFAGRFLAVWIAPSGDGTEKEDTEGRATINRRRYTTLLKIATLSYLFVNGLAKRTHNRTAEWMDSVPLLESSLEACPRSIKSNLEMSKIYSGLVHHKLDLKRSLSLIGTAQSIDPTFCDVHQQYAHVYFQQSKYTHFEEEMVKSLLCPFTMGQALNNWNKYWKVVLNAGQNTEARERYEKYMARIQEEVARKEKEEGERSSNSHRGGVKDEL